LINSEKAKVREVSHQNTLLEAEKKTADQLKEEIDVKTQTLNNLKEQLTSMTNELKTVVENSKRLQEEKNKHKGMVQDMHRQLTDAEIEHRETRFKVQAQEDKVKGLHQNIDLLNKRDDQLKLDVNHLEDKLKQNINEIEKRKISMADLNDKVIKGRKDQENGSTIIKISEEELLLIKNDIQQLDAQISINDKKFSDLRDDLRQSNEAFARNEILKAFTYEKLQEVEMEITDLKKRYCEQQKKYDAQIHELIEQRRNVQQREQIPVSVQPIRRQN
jgi:chromosome segregation ATPase